MIKKIYILAIVCFMSSLSAEISSAWLEIKPGYFFFSDHTLRKIYHGGFEIQGSVTYPLCGILALYGSLGYLQVKGKSLHAHQPTSISQIPFDLGLRAIFNLGERACWNECVKGYLSIGPRFFHFHQHNDSIYVPRNIRRNGVGLFINGGCNFIKNDCFLLGIFGEYAFEKKSFASCIPNVYGRDIQIGGFTFGASTGFVF